MTRLLCFHHAGGAATAFRSWQNAAGPALDVVPVALPTTRPSRAAAFTGPRAS